MEGFGVMIKYPAYVPFKGEILDRPKGFPKIGNMQLTYFFEDEILQVGTAISQIIPENLHLALMNWIIPTQQFRKGELLYQFYALLQDMPQSNLSLKWRIPSIMDYGNYSVEGLAFPYWIQERVKGITLNSYLEQMQAEDEALPFFYGLISFLSSLHSLPFPCMALGIYPESGKYSLRTHYRKRLNCYRDVLIKIKNCYPESSETFDQLRNLIARKSKQINGLVSSDEMVTYVHNDFQGNNILVKEGQLNIIDLEQGLYGGDWLCDLYKIGLLPIVPKMHREHLSKNEKKYLLERYLGSRDCMGRKILADYLEKGGNRLMQRIELLRLDFMVAILLLRHVMGWSFYTHVSEGQKYRGVRFLLDLLSEEILKKQCM